MKSFILFSVICLLTVRFAQAQISPPGLGETNTASWVAFGVRQSLDSANKIQSFSYVGLGRTSNPITSNPFQRQSLVVLNQEFYHKFHTHWHYSVALSYRNQNEYEDKPPYESADPAHKQEIRLYGRFMYQTKIGKVKVVATYRQEFRSFYAPDFSQDVNPYQLRSRFRIQASIVLDEAKIHRISASMEALFSSTQSTIPSNHWSPLAYKEARFCLYYSIDPKNSSFIYSIGYMNNLIGNEHIQSVSYIAADVIWENPFKSFKREVLKPVE